jgi:integrase
MNNFKDSLIGRPNTIKTQACIYKQWVEGSVRDRTKPMNGMELSQFITYLSNYQNLSNNTIRSVLSVLSKYHRWKWGVELDTGNLRRYIQRSQQQQKPKALNKENARKLLSRMRREKNIYTACLISYHTGLRKGEVFGLQWEDVDFVKGMLYICRSYDGPTKNGMSRHVPISGELETHLLKIMPPMGTSAKIKVLPNIFEPGPKLKAYCRKAKIPEITFHGFRHTFATLALEAGRSPKQVQEVLGHSNLSTTLDIYWSSINGEIELGFC